jgi:hypothetical protein
MPHYKKAFDIGTYTGNGGQYRVGMATLRGVGSTGTQVAGSLRFRQASSQYMTRTPAGAGNRKTWTWSGWLKRGSIGSNQQFFMAYSAANDSGNFEVRFNTSDYLYMYGWSSTWRVTNQVFKDTSVWFHVVMSIDTTQATANDRIKLFINGAQVTSFSTITNPTQNQDLAVNSVGIHRMSGNGIPDGLFFDGYMSQVYFVDGQALTPSSFGEYNSDGIWVAKAYSGTYGTNGFYLPMNSSSNYATDQSGNSNNFTPVGFHVTTANTTYDLFTDSPTDYGTDTGAGAQVRGNYPTLNPNSTSGGTVSFGGLRAVGPSSWRRYSTFLPVNSGKWYWEATNIGSTYSPRGTGTSYKWMGWQIVSDTNSTSSPSGGSLTNCLVYGDNGYYINFSTTQVDGGSTISNGDVLAMAVDLDANTYTIYRNNVSIASGSMGAGRVAGTYLWPVIWSYDGSYGDLYCNFGQRAFTYTAPSGYKAICTANIDRPADSSLWFYGDTPDLMWMKNRSTTGVPTWTDTVRGVGLNIVSSSTNAETSYPGVTEINKFGVSIINDATSILNGSTNSHVYWAWKANGSSTVTNTSGTITSQVSANPSTGFSIATYTGTGSVGTIGHGLGTTPAMFMIKNLTSGSTYMPVWHKSLSNLYGLYLNATNAEFGSSTYFWNANPTSTLISIYLDGYVNTSGSRYICYSWSEIPGYSAFGKYVGSGSSDGPFVYLGFRPKWIMWKRIDSTSNWFMYDAVRQTYNVMGQELYADTTSAEGPTTRMDFLSNGFKLRAANPGDNASSATYIYMAFADIPFKFARSR